MESNKGRFVWYELMTTDTLAAMAFYTDIVGWKTQAFEGGPTDPSGTPYMMWVASQGPLGGVYPLPDQAKAMGAPPHWMAHVTVPNVDETVARVKELGGNVYVEPHDIPTVGRFSVIADPQGASISVFKPSGDMAPHDTDKAGEVTWNELTTSDHKAAFAFYKEIFGWEVVSTMDMGPMGEYLMFGQNGKMLGGMMTKPAGAPMPTAWLYYVHVDDLDAALERCKAKEARLMMGPQDIPGGARIAILTDPQGAAFALHGPGKPAS